jgi:hypothetical protein
LAAAKSFRHTLQQIIAARSRKRKTALRGFPKVSQQTSDQRITARLVETGAQAKGT